LARIRAAQPVDSADSMVYTARTNAKEGGAVTVDELLAKGKMAATSGQKDLAREYLGRAVQLDPRNEDAWLWLSGVSNNLPMMKTCLERVLALNPRNTQALEGMNWVRQREMQVAAARAAAPSAVAVAPAPHDAFTAEEEGEHDEEPIATPTFHEGEEPKYPSAGMRLLLLAVEKVTGEKGVNAMLRAAHLEQYVNNYPPNVIIFDIPYSQYSAFGRAMEEFYGRAAKSMQIKVGQELFNYGVNEQPRMLGVAATAMKFMPLAMKMKFSMERIASNSRDLGIPTDLRDAGDHYIYSVGMCPYCYNRHTDIGCNAMVGVLTSTLRWATGKNFAVDEITCRGKGGQACSYRISKTPLE
jgi:predicted hydrocarbon binding protein